MRFSIRGLLGLLLIALFAACTPNAQTYIISPDMGTLVEAELAGQVVQAVPTAVPLQLANMTPEEIYAGLPQEVAEAIPSADAARGEQLTKTASPTACTSCHTVDPAVTTMAGPNWSNVGNNAANRIPGMGPAHYLYNSIHDPSSFVVPGFPDNIMPKTYGEVFSPQDFADIITYLLAHQTPPQ